ncbi:unnamed protein product [Dicrocoelium dendriticum]|nr:unnamed protein product [Dicrocoelium dendriticum]
MFRLTLRGNTTHLLNLNQRAQCKPSAAAVVHEVLTFTHLANSDAPSPQHSTESSASLPTPNPLSALRRLLFAYSSTNRILRIASAHRVRETSVDGFSPSDTTTISWCDIRVAIEKLSIAYPQRSNLRIRVHYGSIALVNFSSSL